MKGFFNIMIPVILDLF